MSLAVEALKENLTQLKQWEEVLNELAAHDFLTGQTKYKKPSYGVLQTPIKNGEENFYLETHLIGDLPFSRVVLFKPILPTQDYAILPNLPRPKSITISFNEADFNANKVVGIREHLLRLSQKSAYTGEINQSSRIEFPYLLKKGRLRIQYTFQQARDRRNCSFEMEASSVREEFEQGMLPFHIDQTKANDKHYCIATPTIPLIPARFDEKINDFVIFYNRLDSLPQERFDTLFKEVTLPGRFSIYYGGEPGVSIFARFGGKKVGLAVHETRYPSNVLDPKDTADRISNCLDLYRQFYNNFQAF